jgi:simple sugar transport system ATP-binding protein
MSNKKQEYALEMRNITKRFPGVVANDSIDLKIEPGELHALLGENGAGKSTLMKVLSGIHSQDEGKIFIHGEEVNIDTPNVAEELGIAMVYQHFMLVDKLTVLENIALSVDQTRSFENPTLNKISDTFLVDRILSNLNYGSDELRNELNELAGKYDMDVNLDDHIWELDVGQQQKVEILKALYKDSQILVLDEPTAVLTPQESQNLFELIKDIKKDGVAIIFITHRLEEVIQHADKTTVIRDGSVIDSIDPTKATEADLAEMMVGKEVILDVDREAVGANTDELALMTVDLAAKNDRGNMALENINIQINKGEIVGIAGVSGNGQSQLAECLAGIRELEAGKIYFESEPIEHKSRLEFLQNGISLIPEDRNKFASVPEQDIISNSILGHHSRFTSGIKINWEDVEAYSKQLVEDYDVRTPDIHTRAADLSGGNLQKLICGRELDNDPTLLIANQPTRGVDVGAIEQIRRLILQKRRENVGIVLISEDLDEIFQMSDRILVMHDGEIVYESRADECDRNTVGRYMAGEVVTESKEEVKAKA